MPTLVRDRPNAADHMPYYSTYIDVVPSGDLVTIMHEQIAVLSSLLRPLTETQAGFAYATGKWTIRETIGHLTDAERVFSYRATAFSRADPVALPSFDQDAWLPLGGYDARTLPDVLDEWTTARLATLAMLRAMPRDGLQRRGMASGSMCTVLALLTVLPGHVEHHRRLLLRDYLSAMT